MEEKQPEMIIEQVDTAEPELQHLMSNRKARRAREAIIRKIKKNAQKGGAT
jgi:hypothetical protein